MSYSALCLSLYGFGKGYQVYLFIATFCLPCLSLLNVIQCMNCDLIKVLKREALFILKVISHHYYHIQYIQNSLLLSFFFSGRPGVGKTTVMREIARILSDEFHKRVVR